MIWTIVYLFFVADIKIYHTTSLNFWLVKIQDDRPSITEQNRHTKALNEVSIGYRNGRSSLSTKVKTLDKEVNMLKQAILDLKNGQIHSKVQTSSRSLNEDVFFSLGSSKYIECYKCIITYDTSYVNSHRGAIDPAIGIFKAPSKGNYLFQFHAVVEKNKQARVQFLINNIPRLNMWNQNNFRGSIFYRHSMVSQSFIHPMEKGDTMAVRLLEGALKGSVIEPFTTFTGMKI